MRWEDERYIRFYTNNPPEWKALSWRARGLFGLLLRAVDRAGILRVGKLGLRGVAVAIDAPWTEIEEPLRELLDDGCARYHEDQQAVLIPNFIEAQETPQSDVARKRKSRELARAGLIPSAEKYAVKDGQEVTPRDRPSRNVTENHAPSHDVTSGHSDPICAVPSDPPVPSDARACVDRSRLLAKWERHGLLQVDGALREQVCRLAEEYARASKRDATEVAVEAVTHAAAIFGAWRVPKGPLPHLMFKHWDEIQTAMSGKQPEPRVPTAPAIRPPPEFRDPKKAERDRNASPPPPGLLEDLGRKLL